MIKKKSDALKEVERICQEEKYCFREIISEYKDRRIVNQRAYISRKLFQDGFKISTIAEVLKKDRSCIYHYQNDKFKDVK